MKRLIRIIVLTVIFAVTILTGCKEKSYGILYTIFKLGYKNWKPLEKKSEAVNPLLSGEYIVAGERALIISIKDSFTYSVRFMPEQLNEGVKHLEGYITTLNNKQYLNIFTDDDDYLFFRLDSISDSLQVKLITDRVEAYKLNTDLGEWLAKGGEIPDTSAALFTLPMKKTGENEAIRFCKNKLRPQVRDISSFKLYEKLFPDDEEIQTLREKAILATVNGTNSVSKLYKLATEYPPSEEKAIARAKQVCYTTTNCIDFLNFFPAHCSRDTMTEKAFRYAVTESDYRTLVRTFPAHEKSVQLITKLYFIEKKKCKTYAELKAMNERFLSDPQMAGVTEAILMFDRIPFGQIKFNKHSFLLTQESKEMLDRILFSISEVNKEKQVIRDVYIGIACNTIPQKHLSADQINFHQSVNRCISFKKHIMANGIKNVNFHFYPMGTVAGAKDTLSADGQVNVTLNDKQADEYKARFVKLCLTMKGFIIPDANRELVNSSYLREEDLENYCCEVIAARVKEDKRAEVKVIPANFLIETYGSDLPEFDKIQLKFLACFKEKKIRREPMEFVMEVK